MEEGLGLYIHIPYCLSKCPYCAFASRPEPPPPEFAAGLLRELVLAAPNKPATVHAGGGTPTLMGGAFWQTLLAGLDLSRCTEATIETNPAVLTLEGYRELRQAGFDRISIGAQSFSDGNLRRLGRVHTSGQALDAVALARTGGFENISIDLIYGLPGQTRRLWAGDLDTALSLSPKHISCYELTLEKGTPMGDAGRKASDSQGAAMFMMAHARLTEAGYTHYEVSNYALPGWESKHNQSYWERRPYIGAGPSAHGFTGTERYWNTPDTGRYLQLIEKGVLPRDGREFITAADALREEIMLGLRTLKGTRASVLPPPVVDKFAGYGWLERRGTMVVPTPEGMLWADGMAAELAE